MNVRRSLIILLYRESHNNASTIAKFSEISTFEKREWKKYWKKSRERYNHIMTSSRYISIESLSEKQKTLIWVGMMSLSLLTGYIMYLKPEGLKVPVYIAIIALVVFFVVGLAILLHGRVTNERYHNLIQSIILLMSVIPLWIAFDPAEKQCRVNLILVSSDLSCRIGFGIGALILVIIFILSFTLLKRK